MEEFHLDFLGIGTIKSGTSLLADLLMQHPEIQWASRKELNYFNHRQADHSPNPYHRQPFSFYRQFFPPHKQMAEKWGEFSPVYIADPEGMKHIQTRFPSVRIIVSLRHPVQRAWSHYLYARDFLQTIPQDLSFIDAIHQYPWLQSLGMYANQLEHLFSLFPREQCLVLFFEEFVQDPIHASRSVYRHVGVDDSFTPAITQVNARKQVRFQVVENIIHTLSKLKTTAGKNTLDHIYNSPLYPVLLKVKHRIRDTNIKPGTNEVLPTEDFNRLYPVFQADMERTLKLLNRESESWPVIG